MEALYVFDCGFRDRGFKAIAGVDEAGRGPIAGPVIASAVILPEHIRIQGLNDSKKIEAVKRHRIFWDILSSAQDIGVGIAGTDLIEKHNILGATLIAMKKAVLNLSTLPDLLIIDALRIPHLNITQHPQIKGDSLSASIAAASIVAKVVRDSLMKLYHEDYPAYGFDKHKGYGTAMHLEAVRRHGHCPIHRLGFRGVAKLKDLFG